MKKLIIISLFPLLTSFTMCGHRGAPKPPLTYNPSVPEVYPPVQEFKSPLIWWERVETFEDGRKIPQTEKIKYRVIINFGKREVETEENYFKDKPIEPKEKRCYSIVAVYGKNKSKKSEPLCIVGREPIEEVPRVTKTLEGDGLIKIEIAPHENFKVEVFKNQKEPYVRPYRILDEGSKEFIDKEVENGKSYTYLLRFSKGKLKGRFAEPIRLTPKDTLPPEPPGNPLLIKGEKCLLVWEPSPSKDTVAYLIETDKGKFKTSGIYFTLTECPKELELFAVDKAGNLSSPVKPEVIDEEGSSSNGK
ncbi:MAG: hypothetical protein ABGX17_07990 [Desulfurobacteriaceae bacterium]